MEKEQIKKTWIGLLVPFIAGLLILIAGISWNILGSKSSGTQTYSFYLGLLGLVVVISVGMKLIKFKKYLKDNYL